MVFSPPLFIFFRATTSSWENQCQNIAFQTFLSRLCGWEVTFAEYIPPFFPTMQRLRCQAKVEAKTLKLHTPGCMDVHNIKCVVDNTINMWLCSQETFFFKYKCIDTWNDLHHFSHGCNSANIFTPLFAGHLVLHGSVLLFPHQLLWGFSFSHPKIASSHILTREDQPQASVSVLVISLPLTRSLSIMQHAARRCFPTTGLGFWGSVPLAGRSRQMEGLCVQPGLLDSDPAVCKWALGSFFL